jgi:hypothetical protein
MSSETSETETPSETSTTNQTATENEPGQSILTRDDALRMLTDALGEAQIDEPEALVKLLIFLGDKFADHPGLKATIKTLVLAAFDNSIVHAIAFEDYVEAIRAGWNPLETVRAALREVIQEEGHDQTGDPRLTGVAADGPGMTRLKLKWAGIARLFLKGPATLAVQEIIDGLSEYIGEALADRDVDTLALLLRWFVAESEEVTIERFKRWLEAADFLTKREPPTNGGGGHHG